MNTVSRSVVTSTPIEEFKFFSKNIFQYDKVIGSNYDFTRIEKYSKDLEECIKIVQRENSDMIRCYGYIHFCIYGKIPIATFFNTGGNPEYKYEKYHLVVNMTETLFNYRKTTSLRQYIFSSLFQ